MRRNKTARQNNAPRLGLFSNSNAALRTLSNGPDGPREEPFRSQYVELDIPPEERVDLVDLKEGQCRWPIGDPQEEGFHFCGKDKCETGPYCEYHAQIAFQPLSRQSARNRALVQKEAAPERIAKKA